MDTGSVKVLAVETTREEIDYAHKTAGAEIAEALTALVPGGAAGDAAGAAGDAAGAAAAGADRPHFRLPLAQEKVRIEIAGVPTAVANGLRRVLKDEMRGRCLTFDREGFKREESTDRFMDHDFVLTRMRMIPLRPQIPEQVVKNLRLSLFAENTSDNVMTVYSGDLVVAQGDLSEPLFNPTHELAFLQPGCTLRIDDIYLAEGFGRQDAAFIVAVRTVSRPLDLEEVPRAETHDSGGKATEQSGFTESSLVANPRRHEISAFFPAVPEGGHVSLVAVCDACAVVMERLRFIQGVLQTPGATQRASNAYYLTSAEDGGRTKGILGIRDETDTIGNILARSVYELAPDISFVGYTCIPHESVMKLTVIHAVAEADEIRKIVERAIRHAHGTFNAIQRGVKATM